MGAGTFVQNPKNLEKLIKFDSYNVFLWHFFPGIYGYLEFRDIVIFFMRPSFSFFLTYLVSHVNKLKLGKVVLNRKKKIITKEWTQNNVTGYVYELLRQQSILFQPSCSILRLTQNYSIHLIQKIHWNQSRIRLSTTHGTYRTKRHFNSAVVL